MIKRQLAIFQVVIGWGWEWRWYTDVPTQARATIDQALDGGVTLLDTADMYGGVLCDTCSPAATHKGSSTSTSGC